MHISKYVYEYETKNFLVLINTLTFKIIKLKSTEINYWRKRQFRNLNLELLHLLTKNNMLLSNLSEDKSLLDKAIRISNSKNSLSPTYTIYVTDECNLKCTYCFQNDIQVKKEGVLTADKIEHIFYAIKQIHGDRTPPPNICLFGGEPLLKSNQLVIQNIFKKIYENGYRNTGIVTNGINIDLYENVFREFSSLINYIKVTLNGPEKIHNQMRLSRTKEQTYRKIIENLKFVLNKFKNIQIYVNVLIDKMNHDQLSLLFNELEENGLLGHPKVQIEFGRIQFRLNPGDIGYKNSLDYADYYPMLLKLRENDSRFKRSMMTGSEVSFLSNLLNYWETNGKPILPNLKGCEAAYPGRYCFYPDGLIYPCTEIAGMKEYYVGEYTPTFKYDYKNEWLKYRPYLIENCLNCKYIGICNAGCPVSNLSINKDINKVYCLKIEESLLKLLQSMEKGGFFDEEYY